MSERKPTYEELEVSVREQAETIRRLMQRIEELETALQSAHRQSAPFRRRDEKKKPTAEKKRPGRKPGHAAEYRRPPEKADVEETVPLPECPHCHGEVTDVKPLIQWIEEIPPARPVWIQLTTYSGVCSKCGEVHSRHPWQTSTARGAASTHLGPRAQALAVALSHRSGLSMGRTCQALRVLCGLKLSRGGLAQLLQRAARRTESWFQDIVESIRRSAAVFADETSWYVGEPGWWLWTFTTPTATLYCVDKSRGSDVVHETLGDDFQGMLVSDCLATYNPIDCRKHKCIAHHLRKLKEHEESLAKRGIQSNYLLLWKVQFKDVIATWNARQNMPPAAYDDKVLQLNRGVQNLLERSPPEPEEIAFRDRLRRQREHLLGCLSEPAAEPTNNRAERDLRPAVIDRKLSCGNKTPNGKRAWEILRSIVVTADKRQLDVVQALAAHFRLAPE